MFDLLWEICAAAMRGGARGGYMAGHPWARSGMELTLQQVQVCFESHVKHSPEVAMAALLAHRDFLSQIAGFASEIASD